MKKVFVFIITAISLISCQDDVQFNDPGFQVYKDDVLWRGVEIKAYRSTSTGAFRITAKAQDENIILKTSSAAVGTYNLGTSNQLNKAVHNSLIDGINIYYATEVVPGPVYKIEKPMFSGGSGYTAGLGVATTGGSGTGLMVNTTVIGGVVTDVRVVSTGTNYKAGDLVTVNGGGNNAKFKIYTVDGSNGEIKITENKEGTISGEFRFNAKNIYNNPLGVEIANFQYGTFYKIPLQIEP